MEKIIMITKSLRDTVEKLTTSCLAVSQLIIFFINFLATDD